MDAAAGAGLIVLGTGCGPGGDPRIETGGIDDQPFQPVGSATADMDHPPSVGNGSTTSGGMGSTTAGTNTGSTTAGTTTGSTTAGGNTGSTGATTNATGSTTAGSTTGATTAGSTSGSTGASCSSGLVSAGAASAVAVGKAKRIQSGNLDAWLCRDSGGYYALDNYCPHRGCAVGFVTSGSFRCPCHGATFNFDGVQTNRESPQPMDHLALCIDSAGNAYIDPGKTVDAAARA